jgi:hypothetical protein
MPSLAIFARRASATLPRRRPTHPAQSVRDVFIAKEYDDFVFARSPMTDDEPQDRLVTVSTLGDLIHLPEV